MAFSRKKEHAVVVFHCAHGTYRSRQTVQLLALSRRSCLVGPSVLLFPLLSLRIADDALGPRHVPSPFGGALSNPLHRGAIAKGALGSQRVLCSLTYICVIAPCQLGYLSPSSIPSNFQRPLLACAFIPHHAVLQRCLRRNRCQDRKHHFWQGVSLGGIRSCTSRHS